MLSPTVLMPSLTCTDAIPFTVSVLNSLHSTDAIPHMYYLSHVLATLRSTEQPSQYFSAVLMLSPTVLMLSPHVLMLSPCSTEPTLYGYTGWFGGPTVHTATIYAI